MLKEKQMSEVVKQTNEIKGGSAYQALEISSVGQSEVLFIQALSKRNSVQYGEFFVFEGVTGDITSLDALSKSLKPASLKLNTVLKNAWEAGSIQLGKMYRFTLILNRGDKYQDPKTGATKQAKANIFKVEEIGLSDAALNILKAGGPKKQKLAATSMDETPSDEMSCDEDPKSVTKPAL